MNHTQSYQVGQSAVQKAPRNKNTEYWPNTTEYGPLSEGSNCDATIPVTSTETRDSLAVNYGNKLPIYFDKSGTTLNKLGYNQHRHSQVKVSMCVN